MKRFRDILICMLLLVSGTLISQEQAIFTQYHLQPVLINPGATGFGNDHHLLANYRSKWSAFEGAPKTFTFLYSGAVNDRIGLGAQILSDQIGPNRILNIQLNYAYKFKADLLDMGIGLSTGIQSFNLKDIGDDPFIQSGDILIAEALDGVQYFDASFGFYGTYDNTFKFGLSFPNLVRSRITDISGDIDVDANEFGYILFLGYMHQVKDYNFSVEPSLAVKKIRYVPFQADVNLLFRFLDEQLIGGLTYSFGAGDRLGFLIGTRVNDLRLHYSYDVNFGPFQQYNNGSHEFSISYVLPGKTVQQTPPSGE